MDNVFPFHSKYSFVQSKKFIMKFSFIGNIAILLVCRRNQEESKSDIT